MTAISPHQSGNHTTIQHTSGKSARETTGTSASTQQKTTSTDGDSVEISQEARDLLENPPPSEPWKPWSIMEYETPLVRDSEEEKEFRELLKNVKSQKSDIMSQVNDIFKRHGISQADFGKVKIEVDSSGKIAVGGVRDPKAAKTIEKALNEDKSLGKKLLQFQRDEKELSKQIKEYSGCTLFELTMTQQGDINKRIRARVEEVMKDNPPLDSFYHNLSFLGENLNHVVGVQDFFKLGFQGAIDFSGETNVLAEPERNIKNELETMYGKLQEEFNKHNAEVLERLEAAGVDITDEMKDRLLLDASKVKITVDNLGAVTIEGAFSGNADNHKKGEEILNRLVTEMLNKTEDNSYHINIFTSASDALLQRMTDDLGEENMGWDTKVVAEVANGVVGGIRVSSPKTEAKLKDSIQETVNNMVRDSGINLAESLQIEIDDNGKITATNLPEDGPEREQVLELLERINSDVDNADSDPAPEDEEDSRGKGGVASWKDGILEISGQIGKLKRIRER